MPSATTTCSGVRHAGHRRQHRHRQFVGPDAPAPAPPRAPCWCRRPPSSGTCRPPRSASGGRVSHAASGGRPASASWPKPPRQAVPAEVSLKDPKDFTLIGRTHRARTAYPRPTAAPNSRRTCSCPACWWPWSPTRRASAASCKSFDDKARRGHQGRDRRGRDSRMAWPCWRRISGPRRRAATR
jgi:hypothetical protein